MALTEDPKDRGTIVAQGGGKVSVILLSQKLDPDKLLLAKYGHNCCTQALIPLALEGTEAGKVKACHALAKIASISNPEIAFPGERVSYAGVVLFSSFSFP